LFQVEREQTERSTIEIYARHRHHRY